VSDRTLQGEGQQLTAILICPDGELKRQFQSTVAGLGQRLLTVAELHDYPTARDLAEQLRQRHPDVLLVDVGTQRDRALELLGQMGRDWTDLSVVALHRSNDPETILQCLRGGAAEFLSSPFPANDVGQALDRMLRRKSLEARPKAAGRGLVFAFAPAKGGSGATTLVSNTAFQIKKNNSGKVLLADFHMTAGVAAFLLRINHPYSVLDALKHSSQLDPSLWGSLVGNRDGLDVLPAPERPEPALIEPYPVQEVLEYARSAYAYVLVDLGSVCESISMATLTVADEIFMVCSCEMPSLFMMRRTLPLLEEMGHSREHIHVLVNRVSRRTELATGDMEKIFRAKVYTTFPTDTAAVMHALREGQAIAEGSDLGKAITRFAKEIVGKQSGDPKASGIGVIKELLSGI
jgi:pilus assembly protein CpaE